MEDGFRSRVPGFGMEADDSGGLLRIAFSVEQDLLPRSAMVEGPPISMLQPTLNFMRHHAHAKFARKRGRISAVVRRAIRMPEQSVDAVFSSMCGKGKSHLFYPLSVAKVPKPEKKRR